MTPHPYTQLGHAVCSIIHLLIKKWMILQLHAFPRWVYIYIYKYIYPCLCQMSPGFLLRSICKGQMQAQSSWTQSQWCDDEAYSCDNSTLSPRWIPPGCVSVAAFCMHLSTLQCTNPKHEEVLILVGCGWMTQWKNERVLEVSRLLVLES